jgi:hypothetical protein
MEVHRINFLDVLVNNSNRDSDLAKAAVLCSYKLEEILALRFGSWDKLHSGRSS